MTCESSNCKHLSNAISAKTKFYTFKPYNLQTFVSLQTFYVGPLKWVSELSVSQTTLPSPLHMWTQMDGRVPITPAFGPSALIDGGFIWIQLGKWCMMSTSARVPTTHHPSPPNHSFLWLTGLNLTPWSLEPSYAFFFCLQLSQKCILKKCPWKCNSLILVKYIFSELSTVCLFRLTLVSCERSWVLGLDWMSKRLTKSRIQTVKILIALSAQDGWSLIQSQPSLLKLPMQWQRRYSFIRPVESDDGSDITTYRKMYKISIHILLTRICIVFCTIASFLRCTKWNSLKSTHKS